MAKERQAYEEEDTAHRNGSAAQLVSSETLRSSSAPRREPDEDAKRDRLSVFWRVFGGTLLSIVALVGLTVYNNLTSTLSDLRREMNQQYESRGELVKKDEFNHRTTTLWDGIKDLRASTAALVAVGERAKILDQQQDRQMKAAEDDRKELQRKMDEWRKAGEDERRENARRLEEQRKQFDEERKELSRKLQTLAERLATVEGRQAAKVAETTSKD